ncbi:hypothetical protein PENTCL1PPCAC_30122, partial [Pristionchus entomophagus]
MSSVQLPSELWDHILYFCDHTSECALSKVCQRLAAIVAAGKALTLEKCRRIGVTLPSDAILALSFMSAKFPLEARLLLAHDPFGGSICLVPSTVRGYDEAITEGRKQAFSSQWRTADEMERGAIELTLDYESIGIPKWIIDGIRPRIVVSAVLQRRDGSCSGSNVSARMGLWRLDGTPKLGNVTSKVIKISLLGIGSFEVGGSMPKKVITVEHAATIHGHPAFGGSDGLRIDFCTRNDVRISDVQLKVELPDEIPILFFDWLVESRKLREFRSLVGASICIE